MATEFYQIKSGDTLAKIAKNFKVPPKFIQQRNSIIKDPAKLQAGWVLRIPDFKEMKAMATSLTDKGKPKALEPRVLKQYIPNNKYVPKPKSASAVLQLKASKLARPQTATGYRLAERASALIPKTASKLTPKPPVDTRPDYGDGAVTPTSKPYKPIPRVGESPALGTKPKLFETDKSSARFVNPEDILKSKLKPQNLVWEQQPNWFQQAFNKVALKTKEILGGESSIVSGLKKEVIKTYPLGDDGQSLITAANVKYMKDDPLRFLLFQETSPIAYDKGADWVLSATAGDRQLLNRIPASIKRSAKFKEDNAGDIRMMNPRSEYLMHEVLHSNFSTSLLIPHGDVGLTTFENSWAKAREENPWETFVVDYVINNSDIYKNLSFSSLQHERYAWFGMLFGKEGLKNFPSALKPYYGGVFK